MRNVAVVSAIFIISFSIMLITNYFQVRGVSPLQSGVVETLKEINDQNANNPVLQEQIRQLDLLARKAYFVRMNHLTTGVYILLGMLAVFIVCTRIYYSKAMDIPEKELNAVDEWAIKTNARRYVVYAAAGMAVAALAFAFLSAPFLDARHAATNETVVATQEIITAGNASGDDTVPEMAAADVTDETAEATATGHDSNAAEANHVGNPSETGQADEVAEATSAEAASAEATPTEATPTEASSQPVISKVTHNAFRGNNSTGVSAAKGLPTTWDLQKGTNIAWKRDNPRKGFNSPVINGNRVFLTGADEQARELYCYELTTGELLWSLAATNIPGSPSKMPETTDDTGLASSSVATDGSRVCAIFATGDILCADMEGKQVWAKNIGVPEINYGYASSLLIYGSTVIVQYDHAKTAKVMALDMATGAERWNRNRADKYGTWSSPMIASINNSPQLILMGTPGITAYNPANGEQLWRVECMSGAEIAASACSAGGIVFGASDHAKMVAINGADGRLLWESNEYLPEVASPVANNNNLYIATTYGVVASFDTQTGELRKEHDLENSFYSSPMIADGKIYLISVEGNVCVFSADDDFRLLNSFKTGENTFATPAFTDGRIVVRTESSIYCVEKP